MRSYMKVLVALGVGIASLLDFAETSYAQQTPITAIDVLLEPDATMLRRATALRRANIVTDIVRWHRSDTKPSQWLTDLF